MPVVMFIIVLSDPVFADRAKVTVREVVEEAEHGRQAANLKITILRLDHPGTGLGHRFKLGRRFDRLPLSTLDMVLIGKMARDVVSNVAAAMGRT
ncbi:hypothetical protein N7523_005547 [Penicillium sp. IBT 18751x]|nr:hypothetical protein N7523_005867 [Penicillium sp. IBT 18751x]KAJ6117796.1 hypothetical protein N7523_005547 [Penicillium sp. IBT 18751x]